MCKCFLKVLFFFLNECKIGIVLMCLIVEKDINFIEGMFVYVKWEWKKVVVEIFVLNGKF